MKGKVVIRITGSDKKSHNKTVTETVGQVEQSMWRKIKNLTSRCVSFCKNQIKS